MGACGMVAAFPYESAASGQWVGRHAAAMAPLPRLGDLAYECGALWANKGREEFPAVLAFVSHFLASPRAGDTAAPRLSHPGLAGPAPPPGPASPDTPPPVKQYGG
jgi:hypothetical protein